MKSYYRIMPGQRSMYYEECFTGEFIGADFGIDRDLTNKLPENWRDFNREFIPIYLEKFPNKSKIGAGLACGMLWTISKGLKRGDIILCPNGSGSYLVGEMVSDYFYKPGEILPHRRGVKWLERMIDRTDMSPALLASVGSIGTSSRITSHAVEIENLIGNLSKPIIIATDETIEDPSTFALEKHLEDFLVQNWAQTELGRKYDIFQEDGELVGKQYPSDSGPIDILAISKDKTELLVVELKKGRASDSVVGQIQRYMGYVLQELAEDHQKVKGIIIALDDDNRIKRALAVAPNITFYRYQVTFKLFKN